MKNKAVKLFVVFSFLCISLYGISQHIRSSIFQTRSLELQKTIKTHEKSIQQLELELSVQSKAAVKHLEFSTEKDYLIEKMKKEIESLSVKLKKCEN